MSPPNLQGLNIVHPAQSSDQYISDDLLTLPHYPELSAQLDLWTNLSFETDEPLVHHKKDKDSEQSPASLDDLDREDEEEVAGPARAENHDNVVLGHPVHESRSSEPNKQQQQQPPFDLSAILATFGVDPYAIPASYQQPPPSAAPSLAQILALYPGHTNGFPGPLPPLIIPPSDPQPELDSQNLQPANKRARTRKASVSTSISADDTASPNTIAFPNGPEGSPNNSLTPAEDKRRRTRPRRPGSG
ncbi:hypothetical protein EWM64_g2036 [Hericium alpestre]|uniref:Uncharacterized protein n=1 Tax=Hericium alpestre TaxID=135208 RepID=A0A4Z0A6K2_9AGAM|nr:hypothetical protein EWM64_g2036 [Hericium alpestre]